MKLSISYSSLSKFKNSPLEYFFSKIVKLEPEKINSVYGDAGTAVHSGLQAYIDRGNGEKEFEKAISRVGKFGVFGEKVNLDTYRKCFENGKKVVDEFKSQGFKMFTEKQVRFKEKFGEHDVLVIGYIDLIMKRGDEVVILDWKSNSKLPSDGFLGQQEFYSYLYYKKFGVIPNKFVWVMLRNGNKIERTFDISTVKKIEKEINDFVKYVTERGLDVSKYDLGDYEHIFNEHVTACRNEAARRQNETILDIEIYRNELVFKNLLDLKLIKAIDLKFSYFVDGHEFSPKYQSGEWDGRHHLFKKSGKLPIGFFHMLQKFVDDYNKRFGLNYVLRFEDKRNKKVQENKFNTIFGSPPFKLYPYQNEAVYTAIKKKIGIVFVGTSGGKSAITAEICKRLNQRSLIIINRLELIEQTAEAYSEYLGVKVGVMHEGNLNIHNQITVASVQTITAILKRNDATTRRLITFLFNVNFVGYDECQNVKDKSFYDLVLRYAVNADYILGFSGTPFRNPKSETLSMNALVGDVIFSKPTSELEEEGFIVPTKTFFVRPTPNETLGVSGSYMEEYEEHITNNNNRNKIILDVVDKFKGNKIVILTRFRKHNALLLDLIPNSVCIDSFTSRKDRREIFQMFKDEDDIVLISTIQLFASGINVPSMLVLINASASKSPIMVLQAIGRVKRKSPGKSFGVFVDFLDADSNKFMTASKLRIKHLEGFGNECKIVYNVNDIEV